MRAKDLAPMDDVSRFFSFFLWLLMVIQIGAGYDKSFLEMIQNGKNVEKGRQTTSNLPIPISHHCPIVTPSMH